MVDWLLRHQCGLCEGVMDICVETLCCQSTACKQCADKYIKSNSTCWTCELSIEKDKLITNKNLTEDYKKITESLVSCYICKSTCHRAVTSSCCGGAAVCRGCGIKYITTNRTCWACPTKAMKSDDVDKDQILRMINILSTEDCPRKETMNRTFCCATDSIALYPPSSPPPVCFFCRL